MPAQVLKNIKYLWSWGEHLIIIGAAITLVELCGVLLGLRLSEHFASAEKKQNVTT